MSQRDLEAVIGRAVLDEAFRHFLFAEPEAALAGYQLTESEMAVFRSVDVESLDAFADSLGIRKLWVTAQSRDSAG